jgi:hypothetical protein
LQILPYLPPTPLPHTPYTPSHTQHSLTHPKHSLTHPTFPFFCPILKAKEEEYLWCLMPALEWILRHLGEGTELHCTVTVHSVQCCTAPYVLYRTFCSVLYCTVQCSAVNERSALQCTVLYCTVLYCKCKIDKTTIRLTYFPRSLT